MNKGISNATASVRKPDQPSAISIMQLGGKILTELVPRTNAGMTLKLETFITGLARFRVPVQFAARSFAW